MSRYISQYVSTCDLCLWTKPWRCSPVGELQPLSVPDAQWDTLSVDFVVELPESSGHDAVMMVVDAVSKRVHFIPTHTTVTVEGVARLFLHYVWKLHGLPKCVVSDHGPQFVALFTKELYRLLGICISSSTAWHPQMDRQTECINQELDQFLCLFVNKRQDDWYDLLPIAEFQHNNHVHSVTQQPPFLLDTGRIPHMGFEPRQDPSSLETVNKFTKRMKSTTEEAKSAICKAQEDMTRYYNRRRFPAPIFKPGDWVYLDVSDIKTICPSPKLSYRRLGPFEIERQVGLLAYRLKLPHGLRQLHPVFNVVKLSAAPEDLIQGRKPRPPPPPVVVDEEPEWEVEEVLDSCWHRRRFQFLIKWKGFSREHNSWEVASDVKAPDLIAEYYQKHPATPRYIRWTDFDTLFKSGTIASRRSNLGGGVNVRGPLICDFGAYSSPLERPCSQSNITT